MENYSQSCKDWRVFRTSRSNTKENDPIARPTGQYASFLPVLPVPGGTWAFGFLSELLCLSVQLKSFWQLHSNSCADPDGSAPRRGKEPWSLDRGFRSCCPFEFSENLLAALWLLHERLSEVGSLGENKAATSNSKNLKYKNKCSALMNIFNLSSNLSPEK